MSSKAMHMVNCGNSTMPLVSKDINNKIDLDEEISHVSELLTNIQVLKHQQTSLHIAVNCRE